MWGKRLRLFRIAALTSMLAFSLPAFAEPEPAAKTYFDYALELIRLHHRKSAQADWPKITAEAQTAMADAKLPKDTYPAIRQVLGKLNEPHSFLVEPSAVPGAGGGTAATQKGPATEPPMPVWQMEARRIGVLTLPELNTLGEQGQKGGFEYTSMVREGLKTMDKGKVCGWIIDLRQNIGGNMWPMLWGLDPLLGPSPFGAFLLIDGRTEQWVRAKGHLFPTSENLPETPPNFQLKHDDAPVAVLVGPKTASSGEMIAIAFIGRKDTRTFGNPTAGFTSANKVYPLSDGAFLVLTESSVSDRLGREYAGPIIPDEQVADDKAKSAAMKWLKKRC